MHEIKFKKRPVLILWIDADDAIVTAIASPNHKLKPPETWIRGLRRSGYTLGDDLTFKIIYHD